MIIKVLQQVRDYESIELLDKVIVEGESMHGKYLVIDAKSKILSR